MIRVDSGHRMLDGANRHLRRRGLRRLAAGVLALGTAPWSIARGQQEFPQTLYWGSGLIDIPVAWAPLLPGDFALGYSGKSFHSDPVATRLEGKMNSQFIISTGLLGRIEGGVAFYSSHPEYGFFFRGVLVTEADLAKREGALQWFPAVAIGLRNIGKYSHIDRFGVGYQLLPPSSQDPDARHEPDSLHQNFDTAPTLYAVATKSVVLNQFREQWPDIAVSLTLGVGNGLFSDDGGLGSAYAKNATGGLFYGAAVEIPATPDLRFTLLAENNAWDFNLGAVANYRGLLAGVYVTELGAGSSSSNSDELTPQSFYNYTKFAFTLGWQSNVVALGRGDFLQKRADRLAREREQLLAEITTRQRRVAALELELGRYEAQNLLELEQRRAAAEVQLRQEREALRRLEDRLKRVEQQRGVPPPTPPP